jgi:hypothetical protein
MSEFVRYKTSSPAGDLISYLPGMRQIYRESGKKAIIYQRINMVGGGYVGSLHPFKDEFGDPVCMPEMMFDMLRPLLLSQEYVEDFIVYTGQQIDTDMDKIRMEIFTNQPKGSLNRWPAYAFPNMATDLSEKWLNSPTTLTFYTDNVFLNYTHRYRNHSINYFFLKKYESKLVFAGLPEERDLFCKQWALDIPLLNVIDFLELTYWINGCKFFAGCQSFCFQLAEGLKVPRILETFPLMPNVIPIGEHAYDYYHQQSCEHYFSLLMNETNK